MVDHFLGNGAAQSAPNTRSACCGEGVMCLMSSQERIFAVRQPDDRSVVDQPREFVPAAHFGEAPRFGLEIAVALALEDRPVGRRRTIEGEKPARCRVGTDLLFIGPSTRHDLLVHDFEVPPLPSDSSQPFVDTDQEYLTHEVIGVERAHQQTAGHRRGHRHHRRTERPDEDLGNSERIRSGG